MFGQELRAIREERVLTQDELAKCLKTGLANIRRIEQQYIVGIGPRLFRAVAELLNCSIDGLRARLVVPAEVLAQREKDEKDQAGLAHRRLARAAGGREWIPKFDLVLAASGFCDTPEAGVVLEERAMRHGLFIVRLVGDCMEPDWKDGQEIVLRIVRSCKALRVGRDYYVQRNHEATFKRLVDKSVDKLSLAPLNVGSGPKMIEVGCDEIDRMAEVIG